MDSPNPDSGEEYYHTNTQLYGVIDDGLVADYISTFTGGEGPPAHV